MDLVDRKEFRNHLEETKLWMLNRSEKDGAKKLITGFFDSVFMALNNARFHDGPQIMCICGSTRFRKDIEFAASHFTMEGMIVLSPGVFVHDEGDTTTIEQKTKLDELHKRKIDVADFIFVVNPGGYIGASTSSEIDYAIASGKDVHYQVPMPEINVTAIGPLDEGTL
jgi:hypothetical protein